MPDVFISLCHWLLSFVTLTLLMSLLLASIYRWLPPLFRHLSSEQSSLFLLLYSLLPAMTALSALPLLFFPNEFSALWPVHCHGQECGPHPLHMSGHTIVGLSAMFFALAACLLALLLITVKTSGGRRLEKMLFHLSNKPDSNYRLVPADTAFAWCVGYWKPTVYLSEGLKTKLTDDELRFVVAHEMAHASRRDNLRKWLLFWASSLWPSRWRQTLRRDYINLTEIACDCLAAQAFENFAPPETLFQNHCRTCQDESTAEKTLASRKAWLAKELKDSNKLPSQKADSRLVIMPLSLLWSVLMIGSLWAGHPLLEWLAR